MRQAFDGFVVHAEVEDGVHHAGHGELGAGAHAEQQRILRIAQLLAHQLFELVERRQHLLVDLVGNLVVVLEVDVADFGGDGEAGRHGHAGAAHFGEAGALAAENFFHRAVAVGGAAAEGVDVFLHEFFYFWSPEVTISEKSAMRENSVSKSMQQGEPVGANSRVRRIHHHLVEK